MKYLLQSRLARPAALALLLGLVFLFGASGTTWAREERDNRPNPRPGSTVPQRLADLVIDKTGTWARDTVTFTMVVTNTGPIAANRVIVADSIPSTLIYRSYTTTKGDCTYKNSSLTCNLGNMAVNKPEQIVVVTRVKTRFTQRVTNIAFALATTPDPNYRNNIDSVTVRRP